MKSAEKVIRPVIFIALAAALLSLLYSMMMRPEVSRGQEWGSDRFVNFYRMDKDTVDVLFFGSSMGVNAFDPQELYDLYGIRSYNLSSVQQSLAVSYYWLEEALKYQTPKVVMCDSRFPFPQHADHVLNADDGSVHDAFDYIRFSPSRLRAVREIGELDPSLDLTQFYLPHIRYHERWKDINEDTLDRKHVEEMNLLGYSPGTDRLDHYDSYDRGASPDSVCDPVHEVSAGYLDRMISLCNEKGIRFVLVSLAGNNMNDAYDRLLTEYAAERGADYINFCETQVVNAIGARYPEETISTHSNLRGAMRFSVYLGALLQNEYGIPSVRDEQYEATDVYYQKIVQNDGLRNEKDPAAFLAAADRPRYAVFISSKWLTEEDVPVPVRELLSGMGFDTDPEKIMAAGGYAAVKSEEGVTELFDPWPKLSGTIRGGSIRYSVRGARSDPDSVSSICIADTEYSPDRKGLNIAVYDMEVRTFVTSVNICGDDKGRIILTGNEW